MRRLFAALLLASILLPLAGCQESNKGKAQFPSKIPSPPKDGDGEGKDGGPKPVSD